MLPLKAFTGCRNQWKNLYDYTDSDEGPEAPDHAIKANLSETKPSEDHLYRHSKPITTRRFLEQLVSLHLIIKMDDRRSSPAELPRGDLLQNLKRILTMPADPRTHLRNHSMAGRVRRPRILEVPVQKQ